MPASPVCNWLFGTARQLSGHVVAVLGSDWLTELLHRPGQMYSGTEQMFSCRQAGTAGHQDTTAATWQFPLGWADQDCAYPTSDIAVS